MTTLDLNGRWQFRQISAPEEKVRSNLRRWTPATVPGCVHTDLLAAHRIPDPFVGLNELQLLWLDKANWEYRREFTVSTHLLAERTRRIVCEGLDTVAVVYLNDRVLGRADNMFRRWIFDAGSALRAGRNVLRVVFEGPVAAARRLARGRDLPGHIYRWGTGRTRRTDRNWLRKAQYQFGWDWGPFLATSGIWRDIRLEAFSTPQIEEIAQSQRHRADGSVSLRVRVWMQSPLKTAARAAFRLTIVSTRNAQVAESAKMLSIPPGESSVEVELRVRKPELWWPVGQGKQPLYTLGATLAPVGSGEPWSCVQRRIGFRRVELINKPDPAGESFFFRVNGRPVFCKGANWIPADIFPTRVQPATYRRLLESAVAAHMNMLRVWGGGIYESDVFYDLCDELGVMVWHDHMFACAAYPAHDAFLNSVEAEIRHQVRRLSRHPCLALWCGNNENEQGLAEGWLPAASPASRARLRRDYLKLTDREAVATRAEAPDIPWWPSSPSTNGRFLQPNDHTRGDSHFWEVWHRRKPFSRYLEIRPRFNSEFGFQSFPDIETLRPVLGPDKSQWNLTSPVMEQHQRHGSGNAIITEMACSFFRLPRDLADFFYVSQILQAMAIKAGVEHWRRLQPGCMGTLYWQLNDCWPVASWASVDAALRWKALHYFARRFYAPLLVSALDNGRSKDIELWLTSDAAETLACRWQAELWSWSGRRLWQTSAPCRLPSLASRRVALWPAARFADSFDRRTEVFLRFTVEGRGAAGRRYQSENTLPLRAFKRIELAQPRFRLKIARRRDNTLLVTVVSDAVSPFTELHAPAVAGFFSDNFMDMLPNQPVRVVFTPWERVSLDRFRHALSVRALRSTY